MVDVASTCKELTLRWSANDFRKEQASSTDYSSLLTNAKQLSLVLKQITNSIPNIKIFLVITKTHLPFTQV